MSTQTDGSPPPRPVDSPPWNRTIKTIVAVVSLLLIAAVAWRFSALLGQLVTAGVLAYLLNPIIVFVDRRTPLSRGVLIVIVYILFLFVLAGVVTALGVAVYGQVEALINRLPRLVNDFVDLLRDRAPSPDAEVVIGPFTFVPNTLEWSAVRQQLLGLLEPVVSRSGQYASQFAGATLRILGTVLFVWIVSLYTAIEIPRLRDYVGALAQQPGYRRDAERMMSEFGRIWSAYLRGQIILGLIMAFIVSLALGLLGVQDALALGLLSGLLEFVPVVGALIGTGAAVLVAFFQTAHPGDLTALQHAGLVLAVMFFIQQIENNVLVPRVVGDALDLHPLLVMVGVFMGASLAGILGAILAAPLLASLKLVGIYAWRKMFDLPPFPEDWFAPAPPDPLPRGVRGVWTRLRERIEPAAADGADESAATPP